MRNKDEVAAQFVGCWEIGKRLIACLDAISQFCRGLRILNGRRGPVAFRKSGEKPHMPFRPWEDPESRLRLRTRPFEKSQMHFCSDAQMPRSVKIA